MTKKKNTTKTKFHAHLPAVLGLWEVQTPAGEKDFDEVGGSIKKCCIAYGPSKRTHCNVINTLSYAQLVPRRHAT